jgi:ElaB protein
MNISKPPSEHFTLEDLTTSMKAVIDEAELLIEQVGDSTSEQLADTTAKLTSQLKKTKAELLRIEEGAMKRAKRTLHETDQAVKDHPYYAVGIAAGASLLIGMMLTKK